MLEFYTQLSSDETLDGQANDYSKKKFLKENQEIFLLQVCIVFFLAATLSFYLVNLRNYCTQNPIS